MLTIFLWLVLLFNGSLAIIFRKDGWANISYKIGLTAITVLATLLLLQQYGFLVRV